MIFLLYVVEICVLTLLALLLHWYSPRIGIMPIFFYLSALIVLLNMIELMNMQINLFDMIKLRVGGHVYVPVILLIILILYIVNGTRPAQLAVYGLTGVNILVVFTLSFLVLYANFDNQSQIVNDQLIAKDVFTIAFLRGVISSLVAFLLDMFTIIVVYQGIRNTYPQITDWVGPAVALLASLWVDSIAYNLLSFWGTINLSNLPNDIAAKTLAAVLLWLPLAYYTRVVAPQLSDYKGVEGRPTFDILFGTFSNFNQTLQSLRSELLVSRRTYQELTSNIDEIFWLADAKSKQFVYISPAFERLTGYVAEPFYTDSNRILEIVHPHDRNTLGQHIIDFLVESKETIFRVVRRDGEMVWFRNRTFPIQDDGEMISRYAGIALDITESKIREQRDVQLAVTHENIRILNDFIRDASHDLKSPINAIMLKADMLVRAKDAESRQRMGNELKDRALFLARLIDDLFTLSRAEGNENITWVMVDLNTIINEVIHHNLVNAEEKGLTLDVQLYADPTFIHSNIEQIQRVVDNLIGNAIRYTVAGRVTVRTWIDYDKVYMSVQDTGIGIPEEDLARVFQRFYRTQNARALTEGTGLGLAICKAIIEKHQGKLEVKSQLNVGTTFTASFPFARFLPLNAINQQSDN